MHDKHLPFVSEMEARLHFLKQGYEVFANISDRGPIDFVAIDIKTGEVFKYDVKRVRLMCVDNKYYTWSYKPEPKELQVHLGVQLLYHLPDGSFHSELPVIDDYWKPYAYHRRVPKNRIRRFGLPYEIAKIDLSLRHVDFKYLIETSKPVVRRFSFSYGIESGTPMCRTYSLRYRLARVQPKSKRPYKKGPARIKKNMVTIIKGGKEISVPASRFGA